MARRHEQKMYLLLDNWNQILTKGALEGAICEGRLQIRILDGHAEEVASHEIFQVIALEGDERPLKCRLLDRRNDLLALEVLEELNPEIRQNLRIPVAFETLIYPVDGKWMGRDVVESEDLSCGGIAFYGQIPLDVGETVEVVIPITEQPLIVKCKILRAKNLQNGKVLYAAKFIDTCHDEETLIRRAVFGVQIKNDKRNKKLGKE